VPARHTKEDPMTTHVLFLCPHSAGKSVFAATYFRAAAARLGVDAVAEVGGTDPDEDVMPDVRAAIEAQGFVLTDAPRKVTTSDVDRADFVVSIGCDHAEVPAGAIVEWDVPMLSQDLAASMNAIHERAEALAARLAT
jgi:protein-tyrosine-phosphatase